MTKNETPERPVVRSIACSPDFDPATLHLRYSNLRVPNYSYHFLTHNYLVRDAVGNDAGSIGFRNGMSVFVDNFPHQKKHYRQEIPIRTWAEFESDIARAGLPLILANDQMRDG